MTIRRVKKDEHVFISGMTGSGKTYLAQQYLMHESTKIFVLDTKGLFNWNIPEDELDVILHLKDIENCKKPKVIYRPVWEELNHEFYDAFFKFCLRRKNCIIIVDEVMQIATSAKIPEFYKGILTRGRELNVSVWSLSQRPAMIPLVILTESTHYFIFRQNAISDRERIADYTGYEEFMEIPDKYIFWYFNTTEGLPPVMAKLSK